MRKILLFIILYALTVNTTVQAINIHKNNPQVKKKKSVKPSCRLKDIYCKRTSENEDLAPNEFQVGDSTFILNISGAEIKLPVSK